MPFSVGYFSLQIEFNYGALRLINAFYVYQVTQSMAATLQLPIVGMGIATIANGSSMMISSGLLKFAEIDGRVMRDVPVAIAPLLQLCDRSTPI